MPSLPRIVIVGGGAGGLELVTQLGARYGRRGRADIALVDAALTHLWKPLLHEVAAGTLDSHEDDLDYLAQARWRHFTFRLGRMDGLDRARKVVRLAPTLDERGEVIIPARTIPYDTLVIAIGSISNDFGIEGVREHCSFIDDRADADRFQRRLLQNYMRAQTQTTPLHEGQLTIAIVGAGATGAEFAAELHFVANQTIAYGFDQELFRRHAKIVIVEAAPRILPALPERLAEAAAKELHHLGIEVHTGKRVARVTADGLYTTDGIYIPAAMKVWAAGIKAPDVLCNLDGLEINALNQLVVQPTLQTTRDDDVYALGDCAHCPQADGRPIPPTAQAAHQQAALLGRSIPRQWRGRTPLRFAYRNRGSLVSLSGYGTVGNLMGRLLGTVQIEGLIARIMYRLLYRLHQRALFGSVRTFLLALANLLTRPTRPRIKLH